MFINNGIHPDEPDGIDATMLLFRDFVQDKIALHENVVTTAIATYSIVSQKKPIPFLPKVPMRS